MYLLLRFYLLTTNLNCCENKAVAKIIRIRFNCQGAVKQITVCQIKNKRSIKTFCIDAVIQIKRLPATPSYALSFYPTLS